MTSYVSSHKLTWADLGVVFLLLLLFSTFLLRLLAAFLVLLLGYCG